MNKNAMLLFIAAFIILAWFFTPTIASFVIDRCKDYSSLGQLGDMYGVINALFSGATLVFLVYTINQANDQKIQNSYQRFEENFFKLIDLHLRHSQELKDSFANFERDNILPINAISNEGWLHGYQTNFEQEHVIKNFVNYLLTFDFIIDTIFRKKDLATRKKYFKLYFAQLHINEKRFLLYHFNFGSIKPNGWSEVKLYLFEGLAREHLDQMTRDYNFDGLPALNAKEG